MVAPAADTSQAAIDAAFLLVDSPRIELPEKARQMAAQRQATKDS
jgi:hypothetical protein